MNTHDRFQDYSPKKQTLRPTEVLGSAVSIENDSKQLKLKNTVAFR